jgi:hypothetical protein
MNCPMLRLNRTVQSDDAVGLSTVELANSRNPGRHNLKPTYLRPRSGFP